MPDTGAENSISGAAAVLFMTGVAAVFGGVAIGISDSLPGIALMYVGVTLAWLAVTYRWHRPGPFLRLGAWAALGCAAAVLGHNVAYAVSSTTEHAWLGQLADAAGAGALILAVLVAPPAILVGGGGALRAWLRTARSGDA